MITTILALLSIAVPSPVPTVSGTFNYISAVATNVNHPSISADGTKIAYQVTDPSTGYTYVHVYNTSTSTDIVVSTTIHTCLPRISRDGTAVAYFGGYWQTPPGQYIGEPYIASATATGTETLVVPPPTSWAWSSTSVAHPPPGISDFDPTTSTYRVAYLDYLSVITSDCAPGATGTGTVQFSANPGDSFIDIDSNGDASSIVWEDLGSSVNTTHIYRGGTDMTSAATQSCYYPVTDGAGDKIAFQSADTAMVSTPATSPNIFTIVVSTDTIAVPYTCPGSSPYGGCYYPAISADGDNIAFASTSMALDFGLSGYGYGAAVANPSYAAAMVPFNGSSGPIFYSVEEANNAKVMPGYYPTVSNPTSASPAVPLVAFYGNTSPRADIITGLSGDYIYYVQ